MHKRRMYNMMMEIDMLKVIVMMTLKVMHKRKMSTLRSEQLHCEGGKPKTHGCEQDKLCPQVEKMVMVMTTKMTKMKMMKTLTIITSLSPGLQMRW